MPGIWLYLYWFLYPGGNNNNILPLEYIYCFQQAYSSGNSPFKQALPTGIPAAGLLDGNKVCAPLPPMSIPLQPAWTKARLSWGHAEPDFLYNYRHFNSSNYIPNISEQSQKISLPFRHLQFLGRV